MKGQLKALGHGVLWTRVWDSMCQVDSAGILPRMTHSQNYEREVFSSFNLCATSFLPFKSNIKMAFRSK